MSILMYIALHIGKDKADKFIQNAEFDVLVEMVFLLCNCNKLPMGSKKGREKSHHL